MISQVALMVQQLPSPYNQVQSMSYLRMSRIVSISISGVVQYPNDAYTISGSTITFTSAPLSTDTFSGVVLGNVYDIGTPSDASVTSSSLGSTYYSVNNQTFTDITVSTNKNAIVAGPITVSGTLTIASGSTFVIA
jgi:hypothetical protein